MDLAKIPHSGPKGSFPPEDVILRVLTAARDFEQFVQQSMKGRSTAEIEAHTTKIDKAREGMSQTCWIDGKYACTRATNFQEGPGFSWHFFKVPDDADKVDPTWEPYRDPIGTVVRMTMAQWMKEGPEAVKTCNGVIITDRQPDWVEDPLTPHGGWGWMYGWRWLDPTMECSRYTLPREVFELLPQSPFLAVAREVMAGKHSMPRWPKPEHAVNALSIGAFEWATSRQDKE